MEILFHYSSVLNGSETVVRIIRKPGFSFVEILILTVI